MAKKSNKKAKTKSASKEKATFNELEKMLTAGRVRKAFALARILSKNENLNEAQQKQLVQAYTLRMREICQSNHLDDAVQMYQSLIKNHPYWVNLFPVDVRFQLNCPQLTESFSGEEGLRNLSNYIRTKLTDPQILVDSNLNEATCSEARLIIDAGNLIAKGKDEQSLELLQKIGRRSDFIDWRLFLQAQSALYNHHDEILQQNIQRISTESPLKPMAQAMADLCKGEMLNEPAREMLKCNMVVLSPLRAFLAKQESLCKRGEYSLVSTALLLHMKQVIKNGHVGLAAEICDLFIAKLDYNGELPTLRKFRQGVEKIFPNFKKTFAFVGLREENCEDQWFASQNVLQNVKKFSQLEKALVLTYSAKAHLQSVKEDDFDKGDEDGIASLRQAAQLYPQLPEIYPTWIEAAKLYCNFDAEEDESMELEAFVAQHKAFPQRNDFLVDLLNYKLDNGLYDSVTEKMCLLESRASNSQEFVELQRRVCFAKMRESGGMNDEEEVHSLARTLPAGDAFYDCACLVMRWNISSIRKEKIALGKQLAALNAPALVKHCAKELDITASKLPQAIKDSFRRDEESVVRSFAHVLTIPEKDWQVDEAFKKDKDLERSISSVKLSTKTLLAFCKAVSDFADLEKNNELHCWLFAATQSLLKREDENQVYALIYLAQLYSLHKTGYDFSEQADIYSRDLFCAAYNLAENQYPHLLSLFDAFAFRFQFSDYRELAKDIEVAQLKTLLKSLISIRSTQWWTLCEKGNFGLAHDIPRMFNPFDDDGECQCADCRRKRKLNLDHFDDDFDDDIDFGDMSDIPGMLEIMQLLMQAENGDLDDDKMEKLLEQAKKHGLPVPPELIDELKARRKKSLR